MRMSTRGRYGLRAMVELARRYGEGPVLLKNVAQAQEISPEYLEQLVVPLRSAGLLRSVRGAKGGYFLARPPEEIALSEVVVALEGDLAPVDCVTDPEGCSRAPRCAARDVWCEIAAAVEGILRETTLAEMCERQEAKETAEAVSYEI